MRLWHILGKGGIVDALSARRAMVRVEWPCQSTDSHANTGLDLSTFVRLRLDQTLQLSIFGLDLAPRIDHVALNRPSPLAAPMFLEMGRVPIKGQGRDRLVEDAALKLMQDAGLA